MTLLHNSLLGILLSPLYGLFRTLVCLKNDFYNWGIKKSLKVEAKVVSIGGISFGGSGKTPMTIFLAHKALKLAPQIGRTSVIGRGYRRNSQGLLLVSDGEKLLAEVSQTGDELYVLAKQVPQVVVIAAAKRFHAAEFAIERFNVKNIILDDGFQHRTLYRNLDIVMLEPEVVLHPKRFFLRENLNSLQRANIVVVLDVKENERDLISGKISKFTNAKLFFGFRQIDNLYSLAEKKALDLSYLKNRRISAFCGIAHPERFMKTLLNLNFNIVGFLTFPDHCEYKNRELEKLAKFFNDTSAEILITTEKDAVKLPHLLFNLPLYYLSLKLQLENESEFLSLVFGSL